MLDLVGLRIDHLVIDRCPQQVEHMRQQDHQCGQDKEDHRRVGNLVPDPFDTVEELLEKCFWGFGRFLRRHNAPLLTHIRQPLSKNYNRKLSCLMRLAASAANLQRGFSFTLNRSRAFRSIDRKPLGQGRDTRRHRVV
jgi:hypothetical protein